MRRLRFAPIAAALALAACGGDDRPSIPGGVYLPPPMKCTNGYCEPMPDDGLPR